MLALAKANLLISRQDLPVQVDLNQSLQLLISLINADPQNSAPYLFAAIILQKLGRTTEAYSYIERSLKTSKFNAYTNDQRIVLLKSSNSSAEMFMAYNFLSGLPFPNFSFIKDLILKYKLYNIGQQMTSVTLNENNIMIDTDFDLAIYSFGAAALNKLAADKSTLLSLKFRNQNLKWPT